MANLTTGEQQIGTDTVQGIGNILNADYPDKRINDPTYPGADIGDQWVNYYSSMHNLHPRESLDTLKSAFLDIILLANLKNGLTDAAKLPGQIVNATGSAAEALPNISVTGFLGGLTSANLWIRVAKVAIGGTILIVGLAKLMGIQNSVVQNAIKVAPLL